MNEPTALAIKADAPCPFCGGQAELHKQLRGGHTPDEAEAHAYFYVCDSCAAVGGWGKSESSALRRWNMRSTGTLGTHCRGEGCPRADLCSRYMEAVHVESPVYFDTSPMHADGQCGAFVSNGWLREHALHCGGAHLPPRCAWHCSIVEPN